ncbi:hypothetical protein pdam_00022995, partial [Pocillopora damicornis]
FPSLRDHGVISSSVNAPGIPKHSIFSCFLVELEFNHHNKSVFTDCFMNPVGVANPRIIPDNRITSSSSHHGLHQAVHGRLYSYRGGAWCSRETDSDSEWLQVDIGEIIQACGVAIQGKRTGHQRVKAFTLSYSLDESIWETYRDESGEEMEFQSFGYDFAIDQHKLPLPVYARYFRFYPIQRHGNCLRVEIFKEKFPGCQYIDVGLGNGYTLDRDFSSSSVLNTNTPAKNGRLNYNKGSSWCAATNDSQPYLQVDFEKLYIICAVSTQGNSQGDEWVRKYTLQSSRDGTNWTDYQEAGILKVFSGNFNRKETVKQILCSELVAKRLRFIPQERYGNCCMRVEIYGIPLAAGRSFYDSGLDKIESILHTLAVSTKYPHVSGESLEHSILSCCLVEREFNHHNKSIFTDCFKNPVGVADPRIIPDNRITASSQYDGLYQAAQGRLYYGTGWCSHKTDSNSEWLQVDIGEIIQACGVAIQGKRGTRRQTVHAFKLSYSLDESNWETYLDESGEEMVRIPLLNNASLFAVPGCQYIDLGIGNGYTLDRDFSSSSVLNANTPAKNGRLNYKGGSSWCAATNDSQPYLQVDFEKLYIVCAVSTQGNSQGDEWVRKYTLQSSRDGTTWTDYQEAGTLKVFSGNFNRNKTVKQILCIELVAKRLRFIPKEHYGNCCMRVEIYGIPLTADNLALGKPARQSSIYAVAMDVNYPRRAVDGVKNTNRYYCASTGASYPDPYWRVDLEQVLPVSEVFILNSGDCCGEHFNGTEIRVGYLDRRKCWSYAKLKFSPQLDQLLFFLLDLALYQSASQSSTRSNYTANKAVDGDVHSCATTQSQQDPWWRVDLGASRVVAKVIVTYKNQMEGLQVWIGGLRE